MIAESRPVLDSRPIGSVFGSIGHVLTGVGVVSTAASSIDLPGLAAGITAQLEPTALLAARLRHIIRPAGVLGDEPGRSIWASPSIDIPLYAEVVRIDPELLMPGIGDLATRASASPRSMARMSRRSCWAPIRACPRDDLAGIPGGPCRHVAAHVLGPCGRGPGIAAATFRRLRHGADALGSHPEAGADPARTLVLVIKGELVRRRIPTR